MRVEIFTPADAQWRSILSHFRHDVYHFPEYVALESRRLQAKPEAIWIQSGASEFFLPYLVRDCAEVFPGELAPGEVYDAMSPYGYPGLLWNEAALTDPSFGQHVLQSLRQTFCDRKICAFFVRNHPILNTAFPEAFQDQGLALSGTTVSIDLTVDEAQLWSHTRRGHQSTINKCKRLGYVGEFLDPRQHLDQFLDLYYETMSRVEAKSTYFFNEDYFRDLLSLDTAIHLGVVKLADQIAAASLFFESNCIVQAHLGGTKTQYLSDSPFSLLLDTARYWAKARGNDDLHIGGGLGAAEDALYRFKSGFSKKRCQFWLLKFISDPDRYQNLMQLWERLHGHPLETNFFPAYRIFSESQPQPR